MTASQESDHAEIRATICRLGELIDSSQMNGDDRSALQAQLESLREDVEEHFESHEIPESFHAVLQQTEAYTVSRLGDDQPEFSDLKLSWKDFQNTISNAIESWEAKHPRLSASFTNFANILSKAGI